jgi:hypothetical protein
MLGRIYIIYIRLRKSNTGLLPMGTVEFYEFSDYHFMVTIHFTLKQKRYTLSKATNLNAPENFARW